MSVVTPHFMPAFQYSSMKLSDHSPVGVILSPRSPLSPSSRPVPAFVTRHPLYKQTVRFLEEKCNFTYDAIRARSHSDSFRAINIYKRILRTAAARVRNFLLQHENNFEASDLLLTSISRCVFSQNHEMASFLMSIYPAARQHIGLSSVDGQSR
eukprot:687109-Karenia_brevis.AAC.1